MPAPGLRYTSGAPKTFARADLANPAPREFCETCVTHPVARRPGLPPVILKVGALDDPSLFGRPRMAIVAIDQQPFHEIPAGLPAFERLAPMG